ncbi:MAG: FAD-binding oxidoreductase [Acetobacteraceae bacterium]|nr:FAD-binding oxidoreductase [Acetobacteraceae bacterium]
MESEHFDALVIGGGIAGATAAAHLAADFRVALIEAEAAAGYHTTGRSAALWVANAGPEHELGLAEQSFGFLDAPPAGFAAHPILTRRDVAFAVPAAQRDVFHAILSGRRNVREISVAALQALIPALRPGYAVAAALEAGNYDIDVAALLQGFLRQVRARGGVVALRSRSQLIERVGGRWRVEVRGGAVFRAPVLVNAAGAWGDAVAEQAGIPKLGLVPKRRTAVVIDPAPFAVAEWPRLYDPARSWYCKPEARTRLMVSPADATPSHAHDVQPEEMDIAVAVARMQQVLDIPVRRVEHAWAGLRTFTPDGAFAFGAAAEGEGFFWFVGQGGDGILTAPAAGRLLADMVAGRAPDWLPGAARIVAAIDPRRFDRRTP